MRIKREREKERTASWLDFDRPLTLDKSLTKAEVKSSKFYIFGNAFHFSFEKTNF